MENKLRSVAVIVFGIIFPVIILFQAYLGINALTEDVAYRTTVQDLVANMSSAKKEMKNQNDYALFSLLYVEHANQKTMINKQVMKSSVINLGFAVISVGMMLIIFGIKGNEGADLEAGIEMQGVKFDLKTGSTGVAMFCVGAIMATVGGVLKNDYQTSEIPKYIYNETGVPDKALEKSVDAYRTCSKQGKEFEACFSQIFFQINKDLLK